MVPGELREALAQVSAEAPDRILSVEFLYQINEGVIVLTLFIVLVAATELGYRQGRAVSADYGEASQSQLSSLQGALLGLLALLLAFSFSMAEARFEARRTLVLDESNAIGTLFLRSQMLPEPSRGEVAKLLRDYVGARLEYFDANVDTDKFRSSNEAAQQVQKELWAKTLAITQQNPSPVPTGLFISSLNDVFDIYQKRQDARANHVPEVVLWLLFFVTIGAIEFVGYVCGVQRLRHFSRTMVIAVLLSLVILVIIDLDRPRRGLIGVNQQSMLELHDSLKSAH